MDYNAKRNALSPTLGRMEVKYTNLWVKFAYPHNVVQAGKDTLCVSNGRHILIHNVLTHEEKIITANNDQNGDGVSVIGGHKTFPLIAYAELREPPRVYLVRTQDLKYAPCLPCGFNQVSAITFSDHELLFGLSGYPECSLVVWKWRTSEMMTVVDTGMFFNTGVTLIASYCNQPIYLAQMILKTSELKIWEASCCGKKCILTGETIPFEHEDPRLKITKGLWSNHGSCFAIDRAGNVFKYEPEQKLMKNIIAAYPGDKETSFSWWDNGLFVQCADGAVRHFAHDTNYKLNWIVSQQPTVFVKIVSTPNRNVLAVLTSKKDLLVYDANTETYPYLRSNEAAITHFGLIPPQYEVIVTLSKETDLRLWEAEGGAFIMCAIIPSPATHLEANPTYPYFAVTLQNGSLWLYSVLNKAIELLCKFMLTTDPLQEVKFFEQNRIIAAVNKHLGNLFIIDGIPGGKFKILTAIKHDRQIADYLVVGARSCLRVFLIPVTSKLLAGNKIIRYCVMRHQEPTMKVYQLEDPDKLYVSLYMSKNQPQRDRLIYATPFDNKNLHELELKRGDTHARIVNIIKSDHMMRHIKYVFHSKYILSYGYDGIAILRNATTYEIRQVIVPHHRFNGGILYAMLDPYRHRMFTLGRDGLLLCNELPGTPMTSKEHALLYAKNEELAEMFKTKSIGFEPRGKYEGTCWLEYKRLMKIERERTEYQEQRKKIVDAFNSIQERAVILLSHNLTGPENERLELQDFNLNLQRKENLLRASTYRCEKLKIYLERLIEDQDRIAQTIKETFWDPIDTPTKNMWAIFGNFDVQSYAVLPPNLTDAEQLERIEGYREIEKICAREDSFQPWTYLTEEQKDNLQNTQPKLSQEKPIEQLNIFEDDMMSDLSNQDKEDEYETFVAYFGSTVPLYIQMTESAYDQPAIQTFLQQEWTYAISKDLQRQLREFFNKEFDVCMQQKMREMGTIIERNARLRYILSEMNYFCTERFDINPLDPTWRQDESPELITKVTNDEVGILPYVSPSEQAILDAKAAEEERIRLLLLADDFKERALMKMMNGVLEVRWEDELRRSVPKPKCMTEKIPENYNEEDLRQLKEYNEQVAFLESERQRYRSMLTIEYVKVGNQLRDGVKKFNEKVKELLVKKIQIDGALTSEMMRMHRMRVKGLQRMSANKAEEKAEREITENEKRTEATGSILASLNSYYVEVKASLEQLILRDRYIEKSFKREFQDCPPAQYELLIKMFKKRPRTNFKLFQSSCTLLEMAKIISTNCQPMLIFGDPLEFVKNVDLMDKYVGIPPIIDEPLFKAMVRIRRLKIEIELKVRACQLEIAEAESTLQLYSTHHSNCKERGTQLLVALDAVRTAKIRDNLNIELQLVMKQAFVELPRTGALSDFQDAILINRKDVEDINTVILSAGAFKIKAMRNAMQFRKQIMIKEWEHEKKKMEISDLHHELKHIASIKVTKEIQQFLKMRSKGESEKTIAFEIELEKLRELYQRTIDMRRAALLTLQQNVANLEQDNKRLNSDIEKANIDVCEANVYVDDSLSEKEKRIVNMRIQANLKRSRLVNQITDNHNTILVLQAELELCRLRTVPILDYKVQDNM